jgi:PPK2 family polyphosphate:nucleotide phosphotransferase
MDYSELLRVKPGSKVRLGEIDPNFTAKHENKASAQDQLDKYTRKLRELQYLLYAEGKRSLLICLQALDAAGKDGTINHVLGNMNPQGTRVHGFKAPSKEEAAHDFLWRIHQQTPAKGEVVIFNRSHYEDVLVVRVHDLVPKEVWSKRFDLINEFEKNLVDNGTHILKFFLHISEDEQLRRFKQRIDDPARHWKISETDYAEREFWNKYTTAYEDALAETSTKHAPWFVIPANHKWFRNLAVSRIVAETLESLGMSFPAPSVDIEDVKQKYHRAESEEEARRNGKKGKNKKGKNKAEDTEEADLLQKGALQTEIAEETFDRD